jgi:hypothetical protein
MNCVVCWESYNTEKRKPYVLNCGHTFCFTCLQDINIILCINIILYWLLISLGEKYLFLEKKYLFIY